MVLRYTEIGESPQSSSLNIPLRVIVMNGLKQTFINMVEYLSDAIAKIFTPSKDDFPATGLQPYKGDPASENSR